MYRLGIKWAFHIIGGQFLSTFFNDVHSLFTTTRWEKGEAYSTDDYYALDVSWQWQLSENLQFSATGNNLFISDRVEYTNTRQLFVVPSFIEPSFVINFSYFFE